MEGLRSSAWYLAHQYPSAYTGAPDLHWPHMITSIELAKTVTLSKATTGTHDAPDLFNLSLVLASTGHTQRYLRTYIPSEFRTFLQQSTLVNLHLVSIDPNSLASYLVPGRPVHLLTGVTTQEGRRIKGLPTSISAWRLGGRVSTVAIGLAGAALTAQGWLGLGVALTFLGTYFYRTFANLPDRSFWGHENED